MQGGAESAHRRFRRLGMQGVAEAAE